MTVDVLTSTIQNCVNDIVFVYNGKQSGVTSTVNNYQPIFQAWYGDEVKEYDDVDVLLKDKFYGGSSLLDLVGNVELMAI